MPTITLQELRDNPVNVLIGGAQMVCCVWVGVLCIVQSTVEVVGVLQSAWNDSQQRLCFDTPPFANAHDLRCSFYKMFDDYRLPDRTFHILHPLNHGVVNGSCMYLRVVPAGVQSNVGNEIVSRFIVERLVAEDHGLYGDKNLEDG